MLIEFLDFVLVLADFRNEEAFTREERAFQPLAFLLVLMKSGYLICDTQEFVAFVSQGREAEK